MYVGYMYQSGELHGLQQSSTIKVVLDSWYTNNIANKGYGEYIDGNAGFCGDRRVTSGSGTGTSTTYYQAYTRITQNNSPSLTCQTEDIHTIDEFEHGNGALTQPIGLISADEAMLGGIPWTETNTNTYLYTNTNYWTVSPYSYGSRARVFYVRSGGGLYYTVVDSTTPGVRAVINLKSDVQITGSGTTSDPFKVAGA